MKNRRFLLVIGALLLLSGCVDSGYQESIRVFLSGTPIVFLIALGFQYLLFRLWKLIYPKLTFSWLPNVVFGIALLVIRVILASRIFDNSMPSWFSINDEEFYDIVFIRFLPSFMTILFIVTRVWLFLDRSKVFTWATIVVMSLYMLSTLPMFAGVAEGSLYISLMTFIWFLAGTVLLWAFGFGELSTLPLLIYCGLFIEVVLRLRQSTKLNENAA